MISAIDWVTFDCYGTLIDWDRGVHSFLTSLLIQKRVSVPVDEVMRSWQAFQFKMVQEPFRRYRVVLGSSLEEALRRFKVGYDPDDGHRFAHAMGSWRPFKDVAEGLVRLKRKFRLGIISNTDKDIIARTLTYLGVEMDLVITSEEMRAYKPSAKGFEEALKRMETPPDRVLHAAFGAAYDLGPARAVGMKRALVRRGRLEKVDPPADIEVMTIGELADKLEA